MSLDGLHPGGSFLNELDPRNRRALDPAQGFGPGTEEEDLRRTAIGSSGPPIRALGTDKVGEIPELDLDPDPEPLTETSGTYLDPTILDDGRFGPTDPMAPMFEEAGATLVKTTVAEPPMPSPRSGRDSRGPRSRRFSEVQFVPRPAVSAEVPPALHYRVLFWKKLSLGATALAIVAAAVAVAVVVVSKRKENAAEPAKPAATAPAARSKPAPTPAVAKATAPAKATDTAARSAATTTPAGEAERATGTAPAAGAPTVTLVVESSAAEKSDPAEPEPEPEPDPEPAPARHAKPARGAAQPSPAAARVSARQRGSAAYEQGVRQFMDGSLPAAERSFRKALKLDPGHAAAYKGLGLVYRRSGQKRRAINELRAYLRAAPNARDAAQIRKLIHGLDG